MTPSGFTVHALGTTDSTNDWLLAAAREGAADRTVAVADFQRQGRGRLGRRWEAPAGSALLCSVLLRPKLEARDRHLCSVTVALAALAACDRVDGLVAEAKWPNDLVVGDRKLAGILAETDGVADPTGATPVVVGLGLNLTSSGPPGANGTSVLEASGRAVERDTVLGWLVEALGARDAALRTATGRGDLLVEYRARLATLGRRVRVQLHDGDVVGVARDVTDAGHLVVETATDVRVVAVGDVVHLRPVVEGGVDAHG